METALGILLGHVLVLAVLISDMYMGTNLIRNLLNFSRVYIWRKEPFEDDDIRK